MKVKKAVILAAGLGTRMLPATKSVPKELFPIVDKPALQYLVEEIKASGIEDILIIISRGKTLIEDHFDYAPELEDRLRQGGAAKEAALKQVRDIAELANIVYTRQKVMLGTGHALLLAKDFVGNEPFAVLYGDDVIMNDRHPVVGQLVDVYEKYGKSVVGVQEVPEELVMKYCTLDVTKVEDRLYDVSDMIEKPKKEEIISCFSVLGRIILTPDVFDYLDKTPYAANGELQLTDTMKLMSQDGKMMALDFEGTRYDMGNKLGVMQAQVETALKHPEIGEDFREYLKEIAKTL
ncbi:MAG: UTP--glucose-1-phosphate uridylyltransferase [Clostridia bacterium]|nr:UTP--glucose-1-phosphate uridylyltransferase [Clostridia bacterium]MBQ5821477.1 UTP--glucose-1-phosphate uridylyltransferase [Clostridia bacterium]